jgi:hypothetical protein
MPSYKPVKYDEKKYTKGLSSGVEYDTEKYSEGLPAGVEYDENKYSAGIDTSYYQNALNEYKAQANKERADQIEAAGKTQLNEQQQAYRQYMQNQNALRNSLAEQGIRGGVSETSNLKLQNQYGNARGEAAARYSSSVRDINRTTDQNIADYTMDTNARAEEYRQNLAQAKWQAEREDQANQSELAMQRWQAEREDKANQEQIALQRWQAEREDKMNQQNALTDYYSNLYTNQMAGVSAKQIDGRIKSIKKALDKARKSGNTKEIIRLEQKYAAAMARKGQINAANESVTTSKGKKISTRKK